MTHTVVRTGGACCYRELEGACLGRYGDRPPSFAHSVPRSPLEVAPVAIALLPIQAMVHCAPDHAGSTDRGTSMPKTSAGLLPYRRRRGRLEVFLVHPGGPFW